MEFNGNIVKDKDAITKEYGDNNYINISDINHETWTFTLDDGTTIDKEVMLWETT